MVSTVTPAAIDEPADAPVRRDVETGHHHPCPLLPHPGEGLQQVDDLHVRQNVVLGSGLQRLAQRQNARTHLGLEFCAATPCFRGRGAGGLELLCSELRNCHRIAFE